MNKEYWKKWLKAAGIRALRTFGQAFGALVPTTAIALSEVNWQIVLSGSVLASLISLATSLAGLPEIDEEK